MLLLLRMTIMKIQFLFESRQGIVVVNNVSTSASYVEVDETPIEDYGQDVLKLDAGKEAFDQEEPSENDEMVNKLYPITTEFTQELTKSSIY